MESYRTARARSLVRSSIHTTGKDLARASRGGFERTDVSSVLPMSRRIARSAKTRRQSASTASCRVRMRVLANVVPYEHAVSVVFVIPRATVERFARRRRPPRCERRRLDPSTHRGRTRRTSASVDVFAPGETHACA